MPSCECNRPATGPATDSWSTEDLFGRIADGDETASEELYRLIGRTVRATVQRDFQDDHDDIHHNIFLDVVAAIRAGTIRKPESLLGFVRTICRRRSSDLIKARIFQREACTDLGDHVCAARLQDELAIDQERRVIAVAAVQKLPELQRRIVEQFYLLDLSREQIISKNNLTETQYRLQKSRAVKRLQMHAADRIDNSNTLVQLRPLAV